MSTNPDYDVALSFAGEDRTYVEKVAHLLEKQGVRVFYDNFEQAELWGKDLFTYLTDIYQNRARFTVMFISEAYGRKMWTNHERKAAQAKAFRDAKEYILPVRFDDTNIPGVLDTVGYIPLKNCTPEDLVTLIKRKLASGGNLIPTELARKDFSRVYPLLSADPTQCMVMVVDDEGTPISGAQVFAQAMNGTVIEGQSNIEVRCELTILTRRPYRLLISHPQFPAAIVERVDPTEGARFVLARTENVGSLIIKGTGYIPGLNGRLNPILDTSDRTYLYADNIAIDGGKHQPTTFVINVPLELEDATGTTIYLTVKHIQGAVSLLQYTRHSAST